MSYPKDPLIGIHIDKLSWLSGFWPGEGAIGYVEEQWSKPHNGEMLAWFRWYRGETPYIYEIIRLKDEDGHIIMRIRHFDSQFHAKEEKDSAFTAILTGLTAQEATFVSQQDPERGYIIYRREEEKLYFEDHKPDGSMNFQLLFTQQD